MPGYPFITFLTSTQTGKVLSLAAKYKSSFVRKQPPASLIINVCARGSPALLRTESTSLRVILVLSLTVSWTTLAFLVATMVSCNVSRIPDDM